MAAERNKRSGKGKRNASRKKTWTLMICLALLAGLAVGGTLAWLTSSTGSVVNTFTVGNVDGKVEENFDGTIKKNVNVTNTGDVDAYIRVKLVTYRVNAAGDPIGGEVESPSFTPGTGWVEHDRYYYYTLPVKPNAKPAADLIGAFGIELKKYSDVDGGKQVLEVMAELIQSEPARAVGEAWGVTISENGVTDYKPSGE